MKLVILHCAWYSTRIFTWLGTMTNGIEIMFYNLDVAMLPYIYRDAHEVDAVLQPFKNY